MDTIRRKKKETRTSRVRAPFEFCMRNISRHFHTLCPKYSIFYIIQVIYFFQILKSSLQKSKLEQYLIKVRPEIENLSLNTIQLNLSVASKVKHLVKKIKEILHKDLTPTYDSRDFGLFYRPLPEKKHDDVLLDGKQQTGKSSCFHLNSFCSFLKIGRKLHFSTLSRASSRNIFFSFVISSDSKRAQLPGLFVPSNRLVICRKGKTKQQ